MSRKEDNFLEANGLERFPPFIGGSKCSAALGRFLRLPHAHEPRKHGTRSEYQTAYLGEIETSRMD